MTIDYSVRDIITAVSEGGLDDVCKRVELNVSKSKTVTVPEYEVTPAVPAVTETRVKTPAVNAEDAIPAVSAVSAVMGERHKHVVTQEEVTTTETVTVKEGSKWVQKEVSTTETKDIHTAQYKEVDLWNAEGKKKIGKHQEPVMESYEVSPAVSAVIVIVAAVIVTLLRVAEIPLIALREVCILEDISVALDLHLNPELFIVP